MHLKTYFNGTLVNTYNYDSGGTQTSEEYYRKWWIDGNSVPSKAGGLTMVGVFNKALTEEEVSIVYTAVVALQNVLFA